METIKNYLESIFKQLPETEEVMNLKKELLVKMEEKYLTLIENGHSENEAIVTVISEFGNIDEQLKNLTVVPLDSSESKITEEIPVISFEETQEYLHHRNYYGKKLGSGIAIIMTAISIMITISSIASYPGYSSDFEDLINIIGLIILIMFFIPASGLIISAEISKRNFNFINKKFQLESSIQKKLRQDYYVFYDNYKKRKLIVAISLCIAATIPLVLLSLVNKTSADFINYLLFGILFFIPILMITIAVYIFITFATLSTSYKLLLTPLKKTDLLKQKKTNKLIKLVNSILWPFAVIVYLLVSFIGHFWAVSWIIFPITGLLSAIISSVISIILIDK